MKNITLKQLKYFAAVVKFKNFGLAADAVAISQPAISMQIKELEREVGAPLIERGGYQLILTEIGLEFHQKTLEILEKQQLDLFGKVLGSDPTSPLNSATFTPGTLQPATSWFFRKRGRPRKEAIPTALQSAVQRTGSYSEIERLPNEPRAW